MSISKRILHIMYLFKVLLFQKPAVTLMIGRSVNSMSIHLNFKLKIQRHPPKSSSLWDKSNSIINISYICFFFFPLKSDDRYPASESHSFPNWDLTKDLKVGLSPSILLAALTPHQRTFFL